MEWGREGLQEDVLEAGSRVKPPSPNHAFPYRPSPSPNKKERFWTCLRERSNGPRGKPGSRQWVLCGHAFLGLCLLCTPNRAF